MEHVTQGKMMFQKGEQVCWIEAISIFVIYLKTGKTSSTWQIFASIMKVTKLKLRQDEF